MFSPDKFAVFIITSSRAALRLGLPSTSESLFLQMLQMLIFILLPLNQADRATTEFQFFVEACCNQY